MFGETREKFKNHQPEATEIDVTNNIRLSISINVMHCNILTLLSYLKITLYNLIWIWKVLFVALSLVYASIGIRSKISRISRPVARDIKLRSSIGRPNKIISISWDFIGTYWFSSKLSYIPACCKGWIAFIRFRCEKRQALFMSSTWVLISDNKVFLVHYWVSVCCFPFQFQH